MSNLSDRRLWEALAASSNEKDTDRLIRLEGKIVRSTPDGIDEALLLLDVLITAPDRETNDLKGLKSLRRFIGRLQKPDRPGAHRRLQPRLDA